MTRALFGAPVLLVGLLVGLLAAPATGVTRTPVKRFSKERLVIGSLSR